MTFVPPLGPYFGVPIYHSPIFGPDGQTIDWCIAFKFSPKSGYWDTSCWVAISGDFYIIIESVDSISRDGPDMPYM